MPPPDASEEDDMTHRPDLTAGTGVWFVGARGSVSELPELHPDGLAP